MWQAQRFGHFDVRPEQRQLRVHGHPAALGARAFDVLLCLMQRRGRLVTKQELLDHVWAGRVVEEGNLTVQVGALRKLLGPEVIATIPGRGYSFTARLEDEVPSFDSAPAPAAGPSPLRASSWNSNLPRQLAPLFGRERDLASLHYHLQRHRLVTLVGAGGMGKSRLAQAAAHAALARMADGAWMVELAGLADPSRVPDTVAQALGIPLNGQGDPTQQLLDHIESKDLLLVLDNCEHLLRAASALAQHILQTAPRVRLLATSQEPLREPDEQQLRLAPLAVPEAADESAGASGAVALFEARARAADSRFALNAQTLPTVIDICRQLDGMPLAIEFAAARVPTLGLTVVRDRLVERFKLLTHGSRLAPGRHQTLRAALEWSHALLDERQQRVFRRLAVFAGGFTMATAQAVAADADLDVWAVTDQLCALVDKSLVGVDGNDPPRYGLLESARAFALEELAAAGETAALQGRHARAIQQLMAVADEARLDGELTSDRYAGAMLPELDNVRAAHAWAAGPGGDGGTAILIAARASVLDAMALEAVPWLEGHRGQVEAGVPPEVAARYWLALFSGTIRDRVPHALADQAALKAEAIYQDLAQERRLLFAGLARVVGFYFQGNAGQARDKLESLRPLTRGALSAPLRARFIHLDSCTARLEGDLPRALSLSGDLIDMLAALDDWGAELGYRLWRIDLLWQAGSLGEAATEVVGVVEQLEWRPLRRQWTLVALGNLIGILSEAGRWQEASGFLARFLPAMRSLKRYCWDALAHLFWRRGQIDIAAQLLGLAEARAAEGLSYREANEHRLVGQVLPALQSALGAVRFDALLAAGAESSAEALHNLMVLALADPLPAPEQGRVGGSPPARHW